MPDDAEAGGIFGDQVIVVAGGSPQKDRCEKLIFAPTEPVPKHAHKPEKSDTRERHEIHRERHVCQVAFEPSPGFEWIPGHRQAHKPECHEQQHREQDARDGRGARGSQLGVREPCLNGIHRQAPLLGFL